MIGLSGRFCAGKSSVAAWLTGHGAREIDVDGLGHEAREASSEAILARFGTTDRKELAKLVFTDPRALAELEAIVHPVMRARVAELVADWRGEMEKSGANNGEFGNLILVNAALLFQMGLAAECDLIIWVDAPFWLRFWRGLRRDKRGFRATWTLMRRQIGLYPQPGEGCADIRRVCNLGRSWTFYRVRHILERHYG